MLVAVLVEMVPVGTSEIELTLLEVGTFHLIMILRPPGGGDIVMS